jgi:hypothetical protein
MGGPLRHVALLTNVKGLFGHSVPMCVSRIHCWAAIVWMGADRHHVVLLALFPHDVLEPPTTMIGGRSHSLEPILLGRHTPNWRGRSPCPSVERGGTSIGSASLLRIGRGSVIQHHGQKRTVRPEFGTMNLDARFP